jgi:hypothetical protein
MPRVTQWFAPLVVCVLANAFGFIALAQQNHDVIAIQRQPWDVALETATNKLTGPDVVDCGSHGPKAQNRSAMERSLSCAREAAKAHKAFRLVQWTAGIDSLPGTGAVG